MRFGTGFNGREGFGLPGFSKLLPPPSPIEFGIDGVAFGDIVGEGPAAGMKLLFGSEFRRRPTTWRGGNLHGEVTAGSSSTGLRRNTNATNSNASIWMDPHYRGDRSQSPTDLGYDPVAVLPGGGISITASPTPSALKPFLAADYTGANGDAENKPLLISGGLKFWPSFILNAGGDWASEVEFEWPAGLPVGFWPSFWTSTFFWPDNQEMDIMEGAVGSGQKIAQIAINGSLANGGANVNYLLGADRVIPSNRRTTFLIKKVGTTIEFYDDLALQDTLALVYTYTDARITRFRGGHDVIMDFVVDAVTWYGGGTFDIADWPYTVKFYKFRIYGPAAGLDNRGLNVLTPIMVAPGGSWATTLPSQGVLYGEAGTPDHEQVCAAFSGQDSPGRATRNTATRLPGGCVVDLATRAVTGTVPTTEGGTTGLLLIASYPAGGASRRAVQPYYVAPAAQASLFTNFAVALGSAVSKTIAYTDFHSGDLGPHTYAVSKAGGGAGLTIAGNGTGTVTMTGTAAGSAETVTLMIACTNAVGQTTTVTRTMTVSAAWVPASWTGLVCWIDPNDTERVFENAAGTDAAEVGDAIRLLNAGAGTGAFVTLPDGTAPPTYVQDATIGRKAIDFTASNSERLIAENAAIAALLTGTDKTFTVVGAFKRGPAGTSVTPLSFVRRDGSGINNLIRLYFGGSNNVGMQRISVGGSPAYSSAALANADQWDIVTWIFTGSTLIVRRNGVQAANVTASLGELTIHAVVLGVQRNNDTGTYSAPFDGRIGDVLIASTGGITTDTYAAEQWIAARTGITLA